MLGVPVYDSADSHGVDGIAGRFCRVDVGVDRDDRNGTFLEKSLGYILTELPPTLIGVCLDCQAVLKSADSVVLVTSIRV